MSTRLTITLPSGASMESVSCAASSHTQISSLKQHVCRKLCIADPATIRLFCGTAELRDHDTVAGARLTHASRILLVVRIVSGFVRARTRTPTPYLRCTLHAPETISVRTIDALFDVFARAADYCGVGHATCHRTPSGRLVACIYRKPICGSDIVRLDAAASASWLATGELPTDATRRAIAFAIYSSVVAYHQGLHRPKLLRFTPSMPTVQEEAPHASKIQALLGKMRATKRRF